MKSFKYAVSITLCLIAAVVLFLPNANAAIDAIKDFSKTMIDRIAVTIPSGTNTATSTGKTDPNGTILGYYPVASDNVTYPDGVKKVTLNQSGTITIQLRETRKRSDNTSLGDPTSDNVTFIVTAIRGQAQRVK